MKIQNLAAGIFIASLSLNLCAQDMNEAKKYLENEQFDKAIAALDQLYTKDGNAYYYRGYIYEHLDEPNQAFLQYEKGVQQSPDAPLNYIGLGKKALANGDLTAAKAKFDKAVSLTKGKDATVYNKIADAYLSSKQNDFSAALEALTNAEKLEPKNIETQLLMGDALFQRDKSKGNANEAVAKYNKALDIDPKSNKGLLRKGQLYARARNYNAAIEQYKEAVQHNPNYAPAYREFGEIYAKARFFNDAKKQYEKYLELCGENKYAKIRYISFLWETANYETCIQKIGEVWNTDTTFNSLNRAAAYSYYELKDYNKGLSKMNSFLKRQPEDKISYLDYKYYGRLLNKTGSDSLAIIPLKKAIDKNPEDAELYSDLGLIYSARKKYDEAIAAYDKKIAMNKADANDYFKQGLSYVGAGKYTASLTCFDSVMRKAPTYMPGYLWKARAASFDDKENTGIAKDYFMTYIEKAQTADKEKYKKEINEAYKYLAKCADAAKDKTQTEEYVGKILSTEPADEWAMWASGMLKTQGSLKVAAKKETPKKEVNKKGAPKKDASKTETIEIETTKIKTIEIETTKIKAKKTK